MSKINTYSYIYGREEEIKIGECYYLGQLIDGREDIEQILEDGTKAIDSNVIAFEVVETDEDILQTWVKVTDIY